MNTDWFFRHRACGPGIEYVHRHNSPQQAWDECKEPMWLLWYWSETKGKHYSSERESKELLLACLRVCLPPVFDNHEAMLDALARW